MLGKPHTLCNRRTVQFYGVIWSKERQKSAHMVLELAVGWSICALGFVNHIII